MLIIWGRHNSPNVQKVMWLVAELDLPHHHIPAGGAYGQLETPEFLALNPHGRVPVIDDAGNIVWESHTILRYIAARYGDDRFWSRDAAERSDFERWMDWSQTALQPTFLGDVFWAFYRTPEPERDWSIINRGIERCAKEFKMLDQWLEGKSYMLGDRLSLADVAIGTILFRYFGLEIDRPVIPNVERWYGLLQQRPAYRDQVMIPFDDLYGRRDA